MTVYGNGGPNSARVWWPAGMESMTAAERQAAFERGWWRDGDWIIRRDGQRLFAPEPPRRAA